MPEPISHAEMIALLHDLSIDASGNLLPRTRDILRAVLAYLERTQWRDIEEAGWHDVALLYAPPENLFEFPNGRPGEFRVATRAAWTWATHFMPLPPSPETPI